MILGRSLVLVAALGAVGCGGVVAIDAPNGASSACVPDASAQGEISLGGVRSGTLFGDVLHVDAKLDGRDTYAILRLDGGVAEIAGELPDLAGGPSWVPVGGVHARLVGSALQVGDFSDPVHPGPALTVELPSAPPAGWETTLGASQGHAFVCLPTADDPGLVADIDLGDPSAPGAPVFGGWSPWCEAYADNGVAKGDLWVPWGPDNVALFDLSSSDGSSILSHSYETQGVHAYGALREVETDGRVAVATMENQRYVFLYYRDPPHGNIVYSAFGGTYDAPKPFEKKLLAVASGLALVVREEDGEKVVLGFDVSAPESTVETPMHVVLEGATGGLADIRSITGGPSTLFVTDAEGRLFPVALGGTSPAKPLRVVAPGETLACP